MRVLGIKISHDASVSLIDGSHLRFSIELEKINGNQRYVDMPDLRSVLEILQNEGISLQEIDVVCVDGWRETQVTRQLFEQQVHFRLAPYVSGLICEEPLTAVHSRITDLPIESYPHQTNHVSSAYFVSPFASASKPSHVLVWDGAMLPTMYFVAPDRKMFRRGPVLFPLLGDVYHEFALNYWPFAGTYAWPSCLGLAGKIMAYIARGRVRPELVIQWRKELAAMKPLRGYQEFYGRRFLSEFLERCRKVSTARHEDAIASWHDLLEEVLVDSLKQFMQSGAAERSRNLVITGGCALNIKWNASIRRSGLFDEVYVPPFANDAGAGIGAAISGRLKRGDFSPITWSVYSGPAIYEGDVSRSGSWHREAATLGRITDLLSAGEVVCALHDRAELGPRALGNRSLLALPRPGIKRRLNLIKHREDYRPISPMCTQASAKRYFCPGEPDPFMLFEHRTREEFAQALLECTHEDGTARLQTVTEQSNRRVYDLLKLIERRNGLPILCNTSANAPGKGFFSSVAECVEWGGVDYIWSGDLLYVNSSRVTG
jgi:carbamoyltransferase